jgi:hypothetical protein
MHKMKRLGLALALLLLAAAPAAAQERRGETTPREMTDSVFAARLFLDRLAETIRRGTADARSVPDAEVRTAAQRVAAEARTRKRPRPNPNLGPAWDFSFEVVDVQPAGPNGLRVRARAVLATRPADAAPVTLVFRNRGGWTLEAQEGLAARLNAIADQLARGEG